MAAMEMFLVTWPGALVAPSTLVAEALLGDVMENLLGCEGVTDPSIDYDRESHDVEIEVIVEAVDPLDCIRKVSGVIRTAVHAAGIATPGWPAVTDLAPALRFDQGPRLEPVPA